MRTLVGGDGFMTDGGGGGVGKSEKISLPPLAAKQKNHLFFACFLVKKCLKKGILGQNVPKSADFFPFAAERGEKIFGQHIGRARFRGRGSWSVLVTGGGRS